MTANHIAFHASERPQAVALIAHGNQITYGRLHRDLGKVVAALRALGHSTGSSAAVCCDDIYFHLLLLLGFEQLGIATVSIDAVEIEAAGPALAAVDVMLSTGPRPAMVKDFRPITAEWHRRIFEGEAASPDVPAEPAADAPLRILRTSGTTSLPKRLVLTRRTRETWLATNNWFVPFGVATRFLLALSFAVEGGYTALTLCLRAGGTAVATPANRTGQFPALIAQYGITHAFLVPGQLVQMLDELPADFAKPAGLTIVTFGGAVGDALRRRAQERLATRLYDAYGTNEAGWISLRRTAAPDGVGMIVPDVRIEVVDDADQPLPDGQAGRIRVRSPGLFGGYLEDAETNARMLRDGWFYPGDVGILHESRQLKILGRGDELLNVGGVKFGPHRIEDQVRAAVTLTDVGACSIRNRAGIGEVYLGVVGQDGIEAAVAAAGSSFGLGTYYVVRLDAIPRNAAGKIMRKQLKRVLADAILRNDPDWRERVTLDALDGAWAGRTEKGPSA